MSDLEKQLAGSAITHRGREIADVCYRYWYCHVGIELDEVFALAYEFGVAEGRKHGIAEGIDIGAKAVGEGVCAELDMQIIDLPQFYNPAGWGQ